MSRCRRTSRDCPTTSRPIVRSLWLPSSQRSGVLTRPERTCVACSRTSSWWACRGLEGRLCRADRAGRGLEPGPVRVGAARVGPAPRQRTRYPTERGSARAGERGGGRSVGGGEAERTYGPLDGWDEQSLGSGWVGVEEAGGRGRGASRLRVDPLPKPLSRCGRLSRDVDMPANQYYLFSSETFPLPTRLDPSPRSASPPSLFGLDHVVRSVHFRTARVHASFVRLLGFS